jgi:hypothetical protein
MGPSESVSAAAGSGGTGYLAHGPGGVYADIVRHMRPPREGDPLIHHSTNRIILVELNGAATTR